MLRSRYHCCSPRSLPCPRTTLSEARLFNGWSIVLYHVRSCFATPNSIIGGGMHIAMHAVGKITLFFCAGAIYVATHKKYISELRGLGRQDAIHIRGVLIASLCIIGYPGARGVEQVVLGDGNGRACSRKRTNSFLFFNGRTYDQLVAQHRIPDPYSILAFLKPLSPNWIKRITKIRHVFLKNIGMSILTAQFKKPR